MQEFIRNVCSSRTPGGVALLGDKAQRDPLGSLAGVGVLVAVGSTDEPKPDCVSVASNDNVTRIVNKRFMRQTAGEEMISIMGGGKEASLAVAAGAGAGTEVSFRSTPKHHSRAFPLRFK